MRSTWAGRPAFLPGKAHTGTSGFTNYMGDPPTPEEVFQEFPEAVVVNGSDDWHHDRQFRPHKCLTDWGKPPLALYHTGVSGACCSGVVLTRQQWRAFRKLYLQEFKIPPRQALSVITRSVWERQKRKHPHPVRTS